MRDLLIIGFLLLLVGASLARPFLMSIAYIYVDLVSPQRISFYYLNAIPFSLIMAILAVLLFVLLDDKKDVKFGRLQWLMLLWVVWVTLTTFWAQVPDLAWGKWSSAWKSIGFGVFLPLVLRTRQRIEAALFFVVLCVGVLTITGGLKTLAGGGGYGSLTLIVGSNSGLYEGSTISTVAVVLIPLVLYLYKYNTLFPPSRLFQLATAGLILAALLIPIGTEARTGLICIAVFGGMLFLKSKRKLMTLIMIVVMAGVAVPFLPASFTNRMSTIKTYDEDESASTRIAVWGWTLNFVKEHPFGGGFNVFVLNKVEYEKKTTAGGQAKVEDQARAFHSAYFETLGEQGYPGFLLYLSLFGVALIQLRGISKRGRSADPEHEWEQALAIALSQCFIVFMVGSAFVGIAYQTTLYILVAIAASLANVVATRTDVIAKAARDTVIAKRKAVFAR